MRSGAAGRACRPQPPALPQPTRAHPRRIASFLSCCRMEEKLRGMERQLAVTGLAATSPPLGGAPLVEKDGAHGGRQGSWAPAARGWPSMQTQLPPPGRLHMGARAGGQLLFPAPACPQTRAP